MPPVVWMLNGPNLNLLGTRQPEVYGRTTLADTEADCATLAAGLGLALECRQTNHEGVLVDWVQAARQAAAGIVINPGGLTHTSVVLLDALMAFEGPVIEVHLSQIHRREAFRHHSYVSQRADGVIAGLGAEGYAAALRHLSGLLREGV